MAKAFTNPNLECLCARVPIDKSMLIVTKERRLVAAFHKDCPEHGWKETIPKNAVVIVR